MDGVIGDAVWMRAAERRTRSVRTPLLVALRCAAMWQGNAFALRRRGGKTLLVNAADEGSDGFAFLRGRAFPGVVARSSLDPWLPSLTPPGSRRGTRGVCARHSICSTCGVLCHRYAVPRGEVFGGYGDRGLAPTATIMSALRAWRAGGQLRRNWATWRGGFGRRRGGRCRRLRWCGR